jgi:hypothetical protein
LLHVDGHGVQLLQLCGERVLLSHDEVEAVDLGPDEVAGEDDAVEGGPNAVDGELDAAGGGPDAVNRELNAFGNGLDADGITKRTKKTKKFRVKREMILSTCGLVEQKGLSVDATTVVVARHAADAAEGGRF